METKSFQSSAKTIFFIDKLEFNFEVENNEKTIPPTPKKKTLNLLNKI